MTDQFLGPRAKLDRARVHISSLQSAQQEFFSGSVTAQLVQEDMKDGNVLHGFQFGGKPSAVAETICSDIVTNLRSSLDLTVCESAKRMGALDLKNTYFHFASSEREWDKSVKGRTKACPQDLRDLMRAFSPWDGGNALLYGLNNIRKADTHQFLLDIEMAMSPEWGLSDLKIIKTFGFSMINPEWDFKKRKLNVIISDKRDHFRFESPRFVGYFTLSEETGLAHQPCVPLLNAIAGIVESIIAAFEADTKRLLG